MKRKISHIVSAVTRTTFLRFFCVSMLLVCAIIFYSNRALGVGTHYWIADGTGNWSDINNWSTTSDGPTCSCLPDSGATVVFDEYGIGDVVIDMDIEIDRIESTPLYTGVFDNSGNYDVTVNTIYLQGGSDFIVGSGNWTITEPNYYWIESVSGNWSDGENWSFLGPALRSVSYSVPTVNSYVYVDSSAPGDIIVDTDIEIDSIQLGDGIGSINFDNSANHDVTIANEFYYQGTGGVLQMGNGTWEVGEMYLVNSGSTVTFGSGSYTFSYFDVSEGSIDLGSGTINTSIWNKGVSATITPSTSTVVIEARDLIEYSRITGENTFYNLTVNGVDESYIGFTTDYPTTVTNNFILQGQSVNEMLSVLPYDEGLFDFINDGTRFEVVINGSATINNVIFRDSDNTGSTTPLVNFGDNYQESRLFSTSGWIPSRAPGGVSTNLSLWLRSDANVYEATGDFAENGDTVSEWVDVISGTTVSQASSGSRPVYYSVGSTGSGLANYKPTIYFDGVNDYLDSPDGFSTHNFFVSFRSAQRVAYQTSPQRGVLGFEVGTWPNDNAGLVFGNSNCGLAFPILTLRINDASSTDYLCYVQAFVGGSVNYFPQTLMYHSQVGVGGAYTNHQIFTNDLATLTSIGGAGTPATYYAPELNKRFILGAYLDNSLSPQYYMGGPINEVIAYDDRVSDTDRTKIASYLALKYGFTLTQTTPKDYIASDGTEMWDKDQTDGSTYNNDLAGLGKDDASALLVTQARSMNTKNVDSLTTLDEIFIFSNPDDLEDLEFMMWGNNYNYLVGSGSYSLSGAGYAWTETESVNGWARIAREWLVQENNGDVGTVTMTVQDSELPTGMTGPLFLFVDTDSNLSDVTPIAFTDMGSYYQLERNFVDGEYFTLAFRQLDYEFTPGNPSDAEDVGDNIPDVVYTGEVLSTISLSVANALTGTGTLNTDYTFSSPQALSITAGIYDEDTTVLNLSIDSDDFIEPNETVNFTITPSPAISFNEADLDNDGQIRTTVTYTIVNDDSANVLVNPTSLSLEEGGSSAEYEVVLTSSPATGTQVVVIVSPEDSEVDIGAGAGVSIELTFDDTNWDIEQTVTVFAVDDFIFEGGHNALINHTINTVSTTDTDYDAVIGITDTLVAINDDEQQSSSGSNPTDTTNDPIEGCTNPNASNFDPDAVINDGTCVFNTLVGCTIVSATNYNPDAQSNDGSCVFDLIEVDVPDVVIDGLTPDDVIDIVTPPDSIDTSNVVSSDPVDTPTDVIGTVTPIDTTDILGTNNTIGVGSLLDTLGNNIGNSTVASLLSFGLLLVSFLQIPIDQLLNIPNRLSQWLLSLFGAHKKKDWGVVYDAHTKHPLDPAYVVLRNESGQLVQSMITDIDGRYGFIAEPGVYTIDVHKTDYLFPSDLLRGKNQDSVYDRLYFGDKFTIQSKDEVVMYNIPMDPVNFNWNEYEKRRAGIVHMNPKTKKFLHGLGLVVFVIGFILSIIAVRVTPIVWNYVVLGLYIVTLVIRLFGLPHYPSGSVSRKNGTSLAFAVMRIFSADLKREVKKVVLNEKGDYYCLINKGKYYVTLEERNPDDTYTLVYTSEPFVVTRGIIKKHWKI